MLQYDDCWLPKLEEMNDFSTCNEYEDALYYIFFDDLIKNTLYFNGKPVRTRKHPMYNDKEEAFFHVTCCDFNKDGDRNPDFRRCERIRWIRKFIEMPDCTPYPCNDCDGIKIWTEPYKSKFRTHLLLEEERYMVILEERDKYYLLITAYYMEYDHTLDKQLKHYMKYHK